MVQSSEKEIIYNYVEKEYEKHFIPFDNRAILNVKYTLGEHGVFLDIGETIHAKDLIDEDFLKNTNIEYFIEDGKIIPIGIVTLLNHYICDYNYCKDSIIIRLFDSDDTSMYKNQLALKNIERAIELKSEEYKIFEMCNKSI